jgi:hypothetical protein
MLVLYTVDDAENQPTVLDGRSLVAEGDDGDPGMWMRTTTTTR